MIYFDIAVALLLVLGVIKTRTVSTSPEIILGSLLGCILVACVFDYMGLWIVSLTMLLLGVINTFLSFYVNYRRLDQPDYLEGILK